jgi:hypothetical protein
LPRVRLDEPLVRERAGELKVTTSEIHRVMQPVRFRQHTSNTVT